MSVTPVNKVLKDLIGNYKVTGNHKTLKGAYSFPQPIYKQVPISGTGDVLMYLCEESKINGISDYTLTKTDGTNGYTLKAGASAQISGKTLIVQKTTSRQLSVTNTIERMLRQHTICPRYRIFVLHPDETIDYQIPTEDIVSGGSYSESYQNGQRRSLSFRLFNIDGKYTPSINTFWVGQKFALDIGFETLDQSETIWFRKGVFCLNSCSFDYSNDNPTVQFECGDKFSKLEGKQGTVPESYEVETGTPIEDVIRDILLYDNGNGYPLDSKPFIYNSAFKGQVTQTKISQSAGSNWGQLLISLGEMLSAEIFYNAAGNLVIVPMSDTINDTDKPTVYHYCQQDGNFQKEDFKFDFSNVVNKVYVIGANINGHTCQAYAENNNADSPLSISRIGYHIGSPINDSNIINDVLARERADYELRQAMILQSSFSSTVMLNPLVSVNSLVSFQDDFFHLSRERFLVNSLSFSLGYEGIMSIEMTNTNNLSFTVN